MPRRTKDRRVHLYMAEQDQELLRMAVELSRHDSASSLVRELVRRFVKAQMKRKWRSG
jgi:Arc/MetJ-type ribon-helix-helix transcriptional regulator